MTLQTPFDDELSKARQAREEYLTLFCWWWPATYRAMLPLCRAFVEFEAWRRQIEATMNADFEAIEAEKQNPYDNRPPFRAVHIDFEGVEGTEILELSLRMPGTFPTLPAVKHGDGVDPFDQQQKPYRRFERVRRDVFAAGLAELWELEVERDRLFELKTTAEKSNDQSGIDEIDSKLSDLSTRRRDWVRDWEIRTAGPLAEKVRELHALSDEHLALTEKIHEPNARELEGESQIELLKRREKLDQKIKKLEKELGR